MCNTARLQIRLDEGRQVEDHPPPPFVLGKYQLNLLNNEHGEFIS